MQSMNYEVLLSESAQKIYIAILSIAITQAINILFQNKKAKKEEKRQKYESFYQEVVHEICSLYKTMNAFRTDHLATNPYEQKEKVMGFINENKRFLEKNSFEVYQELKESQLFFDYSCYLQDYLEVKLFAEILNDYIKLYKLKNNSYQPFCFIQIWRVTMMLNSANYTVCSEALKFSFELDEKKMDKKLYKSLLKIKTSEKNDEFRTLLTKIILSDADLKVIDNIVNIPEEYSYYEDSRAIAKTHMLEIFEQDESMSITDMQAYRNLILQYLYSIHHGNPTPYDDHFNETEDMNAILKNTLNYLCDKNLVEFEKVCNRYKITTKGIDEHEMHESEAMQ